MVIASPGGTFDCGPVLAGDYHICAELGGQDYLNPCAWEFDRPPVVVKPGQTTSVSLQLKKAYRIQVRIEDQQNLLKRPANSTPPGSSEDARSEEAKAQDPTLIAGVWTKEGFFNGMGLVYTSPNTLEYSILIPFDQDLDAHIEGHQVNLLDTGGALQPNARAKLRVRGTKGHQPLTLRFTVAQR
jgi:hypothetical protein